MSNGNGNDPIDDLQPLIEWKVEKIGITEDLYRRVSINSVRNLIRDSRKRNLTEVPPNLFSEPSKNWNRERSQEWDGFSTDWAKYSTPIQTQTRDNKDPKKYGVIKIPVKAVYHFKDLDVHHNPIKNHAEFEDNRSHSLIKGFTVKNKAKIRVELAENCAWMIQGWKWEWEWE